MLLRINYGPSGQEGAFYISNEKEHSLSGAERLDERKRQIKLTHIFSYAPISPGQWFSSRTPRIARYPSKVLTSLPPATLIRRLIGYHPLQHHQYQATRRTTPSPRRSSLPHGSIGYHHFPSNPYSHYQVHVTPDTGYFVQTQQQH